MRTLARIVTASLFLGEISAAQPVNLSGNWQLNVARSRWGNVN
jgi:hypothetical protein